MLLHYTLASSELHPSSLAMAMAMILVMSQVHSIGDLFAI